MTDDRLLRVALIACGKAKVDHPAPARQLYTGSLFRAARRFVEQAGYDAWWILSARHGLVHPDEVLEPYDATLTGRTKDELLRWFTSVDGRFRGTNYGKWTHHGGRLAVDVFAGAAYTEPLRRMWMPSWDVRFPHEGLQLGERIGAFTAATNPEAA